MPDTINLTPSWAIDPSTAGAYDQPLPAAVRKLQDPILPSSSKHYLPPSGPDGTGAGSDSVGIYVEKVGAMSPWADNFSIDQSVAQEVVTVPFEHRSNFMARVMGYQYVQGTKLKRVLPIAHPFYEFMRCRRVLNCTGVGWRGTKPKAPVNLGPAFPRPYFAEYDYYRVTLGFETLPWQFKTDEDTTEEHERYVFTRIEPAQESIYIEGGANTVDTFAFDSSVGPFATNAKVQAFPGGRTLPVPMPRVVMSWYDVPLKFITNAAGYLTNIIGGVGKVNAAAFKGYPAYTLLMDVPQIEYRPNPLPPDITTEAEFLANVHFNFHHFAPTPLGTGVTTNLGHNMAPYRHDRKWYPVSINGDGTTRVYETYDYNLLFRRPAQ